MARPVEGRLAIIRSLEWRPVVLHFFLGELAQDSRRQHRLDEHIALEDEFFTLVRAKALEDSSRGLGPFFPGNRPDDGFHIGDALDRTGVLAGPMEPEPAPPVVNDQGDVCVEP